MAVGDTMLDATGQGGSQAFRQQRERGKSMQQSWTEGAGITDVPLSPARQQRSGLMHNLRTAFGISRPTDDQAQ